MFQVFGKVYSVYNETLCLYLFFAAACFWFREKLIASNNRNRTTVATIAMDIPVKKGNNANIVKNCFAYTFQAFPKVSYLAVLPSYLANWANQIQ